MSAACALFLISAAAMILDEVAGVRVLAFVPDLHFDFFDMRIYRAAAGMVLHGRFLYSTGFQDSFGFTYPPFAALVFLPLWLLGTHADEVAVSAINLGLVVLIAHLALRLAEDETSSTVATVAGAVAPPVRRPRGHWTRVWLAASVGVWCEPVISAVGYGQIDLLVTALVLWDLTRASESRVGGVGIGLAAALKLTPLIFIPYLALTGRLRAAGCALASFLASIAASFLASTRDAHAYWTRVVFNTSRVTGTARLASHQRFPGRGPADQSLRGALLRLFAGHANVTELWYVACLLVGVAGIGLAVLAARRGDALPGFVLTAITGLLISPVSWDHHWAIATPGLLLLARGHARTGTARLAGTLGALLIAFGSPALILLLKNTGARLDPGQMLLGNLFVLLGLAVILSAGAGEAIRRRRDGRLTDVGPVAPSSR